MPNFTEFVRMPFKVEAVQVTDENMDELCELVGHDVKENEKGRRFIVLNRRIVPTGTKAFVGHWVTQMGDHLRVYPDRIFKDQFTEMTEEWSGWFIKDEEAEDEPEVEEAKEDVPDQNETINERPKSPKIGDTFVQDTVAPYSD